LGDVLDKIEAGTSFKAQDRPAMNGEVGVLKLSAVTWTIFRPSENKALFPDCDPGDCPRVKKGDLLISRANTTELIGAVVVVHEDQPNLLLSDKTLRLVPKAKVAYPNYLLYALRTPEVRKHLERHATGTSGSMRNISQDNIRATKIPLPPLSEQHRITGILDKADAIRLKREEGIRLTEELLRSTFLEMFGDPIANERGWPRKPLLEILDNIDSGWSPKCHDRRAEEGEWAVLKLGAVTYCKYQPEENKALPESEHSQPDLEVKAGDLLMTRKNTYDLVAACAFVFETPPRLMLPDLIFRLRIKEKAPLRTEYLWGLLTHPGKRRGIQSLAGGTAGSMPNISKAKLLSYLIELPPKPLQDKFAEFMHSHHRMMNRRRGLVAEQDGLFAALVQRAFRGEL
jgi:type I restriction enzyme S subunit